MAAWNFSSAVSAQAAAHDRYEAAKAAGAVVYVGQKVGCSYVSAESLRAAAFAASVGDYLWDANGVIGRKASIARRGIVQIRRTDGTIIKV